MNSPDPRFYEPLGPISLAALAELTGAACPEGTGGRVIMNAAILGEADAGGIAYLTDRRYADLARTTTAGACFVSPKDAERLPPECVALSTPMPQAAWAAASLRLHRPWRHPADAPAIHPDAQIEEGVSLGHGVVVGQGAQIGAGTVIGANAAIGPGVAIGRNCHIGPGAVVGFALLGDNVRIFAKAVIGESGFGVAVSPKGLVDVQQLGRVILQDGVSIGANTCIDRGAYDDTVVGENTKIDNLVQVGHNVVIGRNSVIAGACGLSGSSVVGDGVQMGGRVGLADHVVIGNGARVAASAGVMRDVPPGESWAGTPAKPVLQFFREITWLARAASRKDERGA